MNTPRSLESLGSCFEGLVPAWIATCAEDGTPNVSVVSQVHYVDSRHIAISFQFFNKTKRNIGENPYAVAHLMHPITLQAYRLELKYSRSETDGPIFEKMSFQLQAIASHVGMSSVFKLRAADVYEVLKIELVEGFTRIPFKATEESQIILRPELDALLALSAAMGRADSLAQLLDDFLRGIEGHFGFRHSMILLPDETGKVLQTISSRGYTENGVGSEVALGDGLIGTAAHAHRPLRLSALDHNLRYGRAVRDSDPDQQNAREIPLPGLPGAASQIAVPLLSRGTLRGVLAVESSDPVAFGIYEETILAILANQLAFSIDHLRSEPIDESASQELVPALSECKGDQCKPTGKTRKITFFPGEDCLFIDGEYFIRNVPARIFWRLLQHYTQNQRAEFTNRELRLDSWLGLPELKDNLESRLILLRKRLEAKCDDMRIVPTSRGRFLFQSLSQLVLEEKKG